MQVHDIVYCKWHQTLTGSVVGLIPDDDACTLNVRSHCHYKQLWNKAFS